MIAPISSGQVQVWLAQVQVWWLSFQAAISSGQVWASGQVYVWLEELAGWWGQVQFADWLDRVQGRLSEVLDRARWDPAWWMRAAGWIEYCGALVALVVLLVVLVKLERCLSSKVKSVKNKSDNDGVSSSLEVSVCFCFGYCFDALT